MAEAAAGENCLIGTITEGNYKTLTAVCTAYKHKLIAESPCDVNIAKQVNILAQDMGFPVENIVLYPTTRGPRLRPGVHLLGHGAGPARPG